MRKRIPEIEQGLEEPREKRRKGAATEAVQMVVLPEERASRAPSGG